MRSTNSGLSEPETLLMSWSGVYAVHVPDGVDSEDAINATLAGWITFDGVDMYMEGNPDPPEITADRNFPAEARRVLLSVNPNLRVVDESGTLDDGSGPVWISIYHNEVQLQPKKRWDDCGEIDGFEVMWDYCVALSEQAQCVIHDPDEDGMIDMTLGIEAARALYRWI